MPLVEVCTWAGLSMMLAGFGFMIWAQLRRRAERLDPVRDMMRWSETIDPCMALFWAGMFTMQVGNVIDHVRDGLVSHVSAVTWWSMGGDLIIVGLFLGRMTLRRELRLYAKKRAELLLTQATE